MAVFLISFFYPLTLQAAKSADENNIAYAFDAESLDDLVKSVVQLGAFDHIR